MSDSNTKIIRGLHNCRQQHRGAVLTIGNFDGLHLGHQKIFEQLNLVAEKFDTHSCLMTFEPLPREYFSKGQNAARLMNRGEKNRGLSNIHETTCPDYTLIMRIDEPLASMSAAQFIENILNEILAVKAVIIGDDFRFGCDRKGDFSLLQKYGKKYQFSVIKMDSHCIKNERVSSSLIRDALANDALSKADKMLGRAYTICGHINHGDKRGRTIGFPTANIHLQRTETPLSGVYSVTMHSKKFGDVAGIANLGRRPTVGGERVQLEVHLFDFDQSIYGMHVCISFQHKIRDEVKFKSFDDLKQQIKIDCEKAKRLLEK